MMSYNYPPSPTILDSSPEHTPMWDDIDMSPSPENHLALTQMIRNHLEPTQLIQQFDEPAIQVDEPATQVDEAETQVDNADEHIFLPPSSVSRPKFKSRSVHNEETQIVDYMDQDTQVFDDDDLLTQVTEADLDAAHASEPSSSNAHNHLIETQLLDPISSNHLEETQLIESGSNHLIQTQLVEPFEPKPCGSNHLMLTQMIEPTSNHLDETQLPDQDLILTQKIEPSTSNHLEPTQLIQQDETNHLMATQLIIPTCSKSKADVFCRPIGMPIRAKSLSKKSVRNISIHNDETQLIDESDLLTQVIEPFNSTHDQLTQMIEPIPLNHLDETQLPEDFNFNRSRDNLDELNHMAETQMIEPPSTNHEMETQMIEPLRLNHDLPTQMIDPLNHNLQTQVIEPLVDHNEQLNNENDSPLDSGQQAQSDLPQENNSDEILTQADPVISNVETNHESSRNIDNQEASALESNRNIESNSLQTQEPNRNTDSSGPISEYTDSDTQDSKKNRRPSNSDEEPPKKIQKTDQSEQDGETCPICLDSWSNSGEHRLVSLKCGHLFGQNCVERWLKGHPVKERACPTCKAKANIRDLRFIYARKLIAVDATEITNLQKQIEVLIEEKNRYVLQLQTSKMEHAACLKQLQSLKGSMSQPKRVKKWRFALEKNLEISKEGGCRVLTYNCRTYEFYASQKSNNSLFPGFGIRRINCVDYKLNQYIHLHPKPIRDITYNKRNDLLLSASLDNTAKIVERGHPTITIQAKSPIWSCSWDLLNTNQLYLGTVGNTILHYDIRNTGSPILRYNGQSDLSPIISLNSTEYGLLSCSLNSCSIWIKNGSEYNQIPIPIDGPFMSMSYDEAMSRMVVSCRPNAPEKSKIFVAKLSNTDEHFALEEVLYGSNVSTYLTRSAFVKSGESAWVASYAENEGSLKLHGLDGSMTFTLPATDPALDICAAQINGDTVMGTLSETRLRMYSVVSG